MDATHTKTKYSTKTPIENLREVSKNIRKQLYRYVPQIKDTVPSKLHTTATLEEEVNYTKELIDFAMEHNEVDKKIEKAVMTASEVLQDDKYEMILSLSDQEAKTGYKSKVEPFVGYKTHIAITDERVITAIEVTTGEVSDGKYLAPLVEKTKERQIKVEEVLADGAYSSKANLEYMEKENITAITPLNPIVLNGGKREVEGFEYNKDAKQMRCPAGQLSKRKARTGKKDQNKNQSMTYYFDIEKCKSCPLREGCYKSASKSKTYSITIKSDIHQKAMNYQNTEEFKTKKKQRYKIEAKNAELKQSHGFGKCKFAGLFGMKLQAYITAFVVNSKRIVKLIEQEQDRLMIKTTTIPHFKVKNSKKRKGVNYFKNNWLLFQWPRMEIALF